MSMMLYNVKLVLLQTVEYKQGHLFVFELKAIYTLTYPPLSLEPRIMQSCSEIAMTAHFTF